MFTHGEEGCASPMLAVVSWRVYFGVVDRRDHHWSDQSYMAIVLRVQECIVLEAWLWIDGSQGEDPCHAESALGPSRCFGAHANRLLQIWICPKRAVRNARMEMQDCLRIIDPLLSPSYWSSRMIHLSISFYVTHWLYPWDNQVMLTREDKHYLRDMRKASHLQKALFPHLNPLLQSLREPETQEVTEKSIPKKDAPLRYTRTMLVNIGKAQKQQEAPMELHRAYRRDNLENVNNVFVYLETFRK